VTWGIVVMQHPHAFNAWSHTCHPFPEPFKDFQIKSLIDSLSWWHKLYAWTGLERPKASRNLRLTEILDIRHMREARLSTVRTGRLNPPGDIPGTHFSWRLRGLYSTVLMNQVIFFSVLIKLSFTYGLLKNIFAFGTSAVERRER